MSNIFTDFEVISHLKEQFSNYFQMTPPWAGLIGSKFDKRQRRGIFVATLKYSSQGAAHRNIIGFRCAAPERIRIKFATNIMVLCTFLEPFNPAPWRLGGNAIQI